MLLIIIPIFVFILQRDLGAVLVYAFVFIPMIYWMNVRLSFIFFLISPILTAYTILSIQIYGYYQASSKFPYIILLLLIIFNFILLLKFISNKKTSNRYKLFFIVLYIGFNFLTAFISNISWDYLENSRSARLSDLRGRIENFIIPSLHENAGGWQIKQSMVAVGSGGIFGVGLGEGTQVKLQFLPEADTDFIISSIAEALGFISIFLIILVYMYLFYWLLIYAQYCSSNFLSLLIIGYSSVLFAHIVITLGMAVALAPITGIPAPFLSYGGSFTLTCFAILGICNNASNNG
tara:strand:- start:892 stop:1767 length:876 start_codon:yes stop_codon:yes gene_type:complete